MTFCAIYVRKSREDRDKPSHRLVVQREMLPAHAKAQGWDFEVYDDGHASAARGKINELKERARLEKDIRAQKIHAILCIELSRLSRDESLQDYTSWLSLCSEHKVKLATPSRTLDPAQHSDWMLLLMEGGFSSVEMKVLQSRMKEGRDQAFRAGKYLGGQLPPPYIYDAALRKPAIDANQLVKMQQLWTLAEEHSAKTISFKLELPYIFARRAIADDRLLFYQALRVDPETGEQIACEWEPCMNSEQADRIRAKRRDRFSGYNRRKAAGIFSNLGIFVCGYCGRSVRGWKNGRVRKDGTWLEYYGCKANETRRLCEKSRMIPQQIVDDRIVTNLIRTLSNLKDLQSYWLAEQQADNKPERLRELDKEENENKMRMKRLIAAVAEGIIDFAAAKEKRKEIDDNLCTLQTQRNALIYQQENEPNWNALSFTADEFSYLDFDEKRELMTAAIRCIRLYGSYLSIEYRFPRSAAGDRFSRVHLPERKRGATVSI